MKQDRIERIGELARKSRAVGLTEAEQAEQQALRREYIDAMKQNMRGALEEYRPLK